MLFHTVARFFDELETISSRTLMTEKLAELLSHATPAQARQLMYFCLGTLNPPYIHTQFAIARKSMVKIIARMLQRSADDIEATSAEVGDYGAYYAQHKTGHDVIHEVTVQQVYQALQHIEHVEGAGSQELKQQLVVDLLERLSPQEGKYVIRIILGTLRLGFSDMTLLDALSLLLAGDKSVKKTLEHAYNLCADLGAVAEVAKRDGIEGVKAMSVVVGIPIRLAAAERLPTAQDIVEKLGPCVAEPKLDGFRLQIHKGGVDGKPFVRFFSRNLLDMSDSFPDLVDAVLALPCKSLICEGEAIAYNPNTGNFVPFQETVKRKRKHNIEEAAQDLPLRVYLFDLLYLNGHLLLDKHLVTRRTELKSLINDSQQTTIVLIEEVAITTAQELEAYFYQQLGDGLEGVVVKRPDTAYQPGKRNFNWIKLKRQESGELSDTLDCVILGYYYGEGKRASFGVGAFLVGLYNVSKDQYQTVAKIGTGLSDAQWRQLRLDLDKIAVPHKPVLVSCDSGLYPDVWVNPERVVMVRADEITRSPVHTAGKEAHEYGYALRFPRYMGDRPDKSAQESTTVAELKSLFAQQKVIANQ